VHPTYPIVDFKNKKIKLLELDIYLFTQNSLLDEILHQLHIHAFDEVIEGNAIYIDPSIIIESVGPFIGSM
jgi:hypothetical protein